MKLFKHKKDTIPKIENCTLINCSITIENDEITIRGFKSKGKTVSSLISLEKEK